jgi:hypothetical protein
MRTTIELSNEHRSSLHSIAARRGLRGYSKVIQEAVDLYIQKMTKGEGVSKELLAMRGTWNSQEGKEFRRKLKEIRRNWKLP